MPTFSYKAVQANGTMTEGRLDAPGRPDALRQMETLGLRPINLAETAAAKSKSKSGADDKRFSGQSFFPVRVHKSFRERTGKFYAPAFQFAFSGRAVEPRAGDSFQRIILARRVRAMEKNPRSSCGRNVAGLGDVSIRRKLFRASMSRWWKRGKPADFSTWCCRKSPSSQSRDKELKSKVMTAMLYPAILFVLAMIVLTVMLVYFIPKFQNVFASLHGNLPLITQVIIGASHLVVHYGLFVAIGIGAIVFLLRTWFASEKGRRIWEALLLRSPIVGSLSAQFAMARFCRMLGTMLGAGAAAGAKPESVARGVPSAIRFSWTLVSRSIERVQQGGRLGESLAECKKSFSRFQFWKWSRWPKESGKLDAETHSYRQCDRSGFGSEF